MINSIAVLYKLYTVRPTMLEIVLNSSTGIFTFRTPESRFLFILCLFSRRVALDGRLLTETLNGRPRTTASD